MGVDHGRLHILVAEEFLHGPDVVARFQQMRGEAVPERVAGGMLWDPGLAHRGLHGPLDEGLIDMMAALLAGGRIPPALLLGKDPLPAPRGSRIRILPRQRVGHGHAPVPISQIPLMDLARADEMFLQRPLQGFGQHRRPILEALAMPHDDLAGGEVHVVNPQPQVLHQTEPGAVHPTRHEPPVPCELTEDGLYLVARQDDGQAARPAWGVPTDETFPDITAGE